MKLGELLYNVQISRFLNPQRPGGQGLPGGPAATAERQALPRGLHEGRERGRHGPGRADATSRSSTPRAPSSSRCQATACSRSTSAAVAADEQLPEPESTAANGPIQGAMVLFLIDEAATEDRPLRSTSRRRPARSARSSSTSNRHRGRAARAPARTIGAATVPPSPLGVDDHRRGRELRVARPARRR